MAFTPGQVLTAAQMNALEGATIPTGGVTMYGAGSAPSGWLLCDGTAVSRTTYAALFAVISTTYGVGNGTTTFNLPNLKGKVPVGLDSADTAFDALGETGGAKTHTLTSSEMPSHTHTQDSHLHSAGAHTHTGSTGPGSAVMYVRSAAGLLYAGNRTTGYSSGSSEQFVDGGAFSSNFPGAEHTHQLTTSAGTGDVGSTTATNQNTGGGGAHNNLQPYLVMNFIIKT